MRMLAAAAALALSGCALGPAAGDLGDMQEASAREIPGHFDPDSIRIHNRRTFVFVSWWTAKTPKGDHYACKWGEDHDTVCKPKDG